MVSSYILRTSQDVALPGGSLQAWQPPKHRTVMFDSPQAGEIEGPKSSFETKDRSERLGGSCSLGSRSAHPAGSIQSAPPKGVSGSLVDGLDVMEEGHRDEF